MSAATNMSMKPLEEFWLKKMEHSKTLDLDMKEFVLLDLSQSLTAMELPTRSVIKVTARKLMSHVEDVNQKEFHHL